MGFGVFSPLALLYLSWLLTICLLSNELVENYSPFAALGSSSQISRHLLSNYFFQITLIGEKIVPKFTRTKVDCSRKQKSKPEFSPANKLRLEDFKFLETTMGYQVIKWDQGWDHVQQGIAKMNRIIQGSSEPQFTSEEYMSLYTTIYNMSIQQPPHNYSQQLYEKYQETIEEFISSTVLPPLMEKHDEFMLQEYVKNWVNYKVMFRWLSHFFCFFYDRGITRNQTSLPGPNEVVLNCFRNLVYQKVNANVRYYVLGLMHKEREGEKIDRALLKNVINIYVEIEMGKLDAYEKDFEEYMLIDTRKYYLHKASSWILEYSYTDYMLKVEECLRRERDRVSCYLLPSSQKKLMETVKHCLVVVHGSQLIQKKHSVSGCTLLTVENLEELSRKFIANLALEQRVSAEGSPSTGRRCSND